MPILLKLLAKKSVFFSAKISASLSSLQAPDFPLSVITVTSLLRDPASEKPPIANPHGGEGTSGENGIQMLKLIVPVGKSRRSGSGEGLRACLGEKSNLKYYLCATVLITCIVFKFEYATLILSFLSCQSQI
jgi:hypothetical protein